MAETKPKTENAPKPVDKSKETHGALSSDFIADSGAGTTQAEPTPEELPSDAKIAPVAEQIAPNQAALAVGATQLEDSGEGKKVLTEDMSSAAELLPEKTDQADKAKRAEQNAELRAKEA